MTLLTQRLPHGTGHTCDLFSPRLAFMLAYLHFHFQGLAYIKQLNISVLSLYSANVGFFLRSHNEPGVTGEICDVVMI